MGSDSELKRLEKYIDRLLKGYTALKAEKQQIEQQLAGHQSDNTQVKKELEQTAKQLKEQQAENAKISKELEALDSERGVMRDRVSNLIGQIERWEAEIDEQGEGGEADDEDAEDDDPEDGAPPESLQADDDGRGGVQKKLFST
jgi:septal ring factor EnvC (AmiA/AmiB activator)